MIVVLLLFIGYQLYRIVLNPTTGPIALTVFDVVIVALTWRETCSSVATATPSAIAARCGEAAQRQHRPGGEPTSGRATDQQPIRCS